MKIRLGVIVASIAASAAGLATALAISTAGAANQVVTLGSTSGTPSANICFASCTFVPFTGVSNPGLEVPFDGTVTSFSVNAGSAGGAVELRVLRPAATPGQYTGAGTSPSETLKETGVNTFTVSLPVKAGDLLGLDNESSAVLFDTSSTSPLTAYYQGSLPDGKTAALTENSTGRRLLLSATVQASGTTTGTTPTATTPHKAPPGTTTTGTPPTVTGVTQSNTVWRSGSKRARFAGTNGTPVGTTFSFTLNEQAGARLTFTQRVGGRRVNGKCAAPTGKNGGKPSCKRTVTAGALSFTAHSGKNKVAFQGRISRSKKLKPGSYTLVITATNAGGHSSPKHLSFTIVS